MKKPGRQQYQKAPTHEVQLTGSSRSSRRLSSPDGGQGDDDASTSPRRAARAKPTQATALRPKGSHGKQALTTETPSGPSKKLRSHETKFASAPRRSCPTRLQQASDMDSPPILTRKNFIKTFMLSLAYSSLPGRSWTSALASEIHSLSSTQGTLQVRLKDFPALQNESGSVRLAINPINGKQGPIGTFYPVIINRGPNASFFAVSSRCTHQGCVVEALDPSSNQLNCFCHNSIFAIDGKRVSGPASGALTKYAVSFDGTDLINVQVPALAYSLTASSVQPVMANA